jgi:hypothetical protein
MKKNYFFLIAVLVIWIPVSTFGDSQEATGVPEAYFQETAFNFQSVVAGTDVSHTYVVQNKGTATLEIQKVHTG